VNPKVVRTVAWVLLFASLGAAAASWFTPTPELDADDARTLVADALEAADADIDELSEPRRADHRTSDGESVPVWIVEADTRAGEQVESIELRVQRSAGRLVYVDDRIGPDASQRLLADEQFEVLGAHRDDSLSDRWVLRNVLAAVSALLIAGTSYVIATRADVQWGRR
jgi:hypothetical protein